MLGFQRLSPISSPRSSQGAIHSLRPFEDPSQPSISKSVGPSPGHAPGPSAYQIKEMRNNTGAVPNRNSNRQLEKL